MRRARLIHLRFTLAGFAFVLSIAPRLALAQGNWEFTPYRVSASLVAPDLSPAELTRLERQLTALASAHVGAGWRLAVVPASDELRGEMQTRLTELTADKLCALDAAAEPCDKRTLIVVTRGDAGEMVAVRELDVTARQLGPVMERTAARRDQLAPMVLEAMVDAFAPLVQLERASGNSIAGKVRAAALVDDPQSPLWVEVGAPLVPVLRIDDRLGRTTSDQILPLPLTLLDVVERDGGDVSCEIHSAARHRLGARASLRLSRYGLAVRTPRRETRIVLRSVGSTAAPLVDYELVEKSVAGEVRVVARTDPFGVAAVAADDRPWRLVYVRQGEHLLARLPLVRGYEDEIVVPLASHHVRLRAEGFVAALRQEVVDTVARRQILAARLQQRIAAGEFDAAQIVLDELQRLAGSRQFDERLQTARAKFTGDNARAQQQIDELFRETRASLARYLDPQEIRRLETQLAQARQQQ